jgi:hypothetical protein
MKPPSMEWIAAHVEMIRAVKPDARSWNEEAILVLWEALQKEKEAKG